MYKLDHPRLSISVSFFVICCYYSHIPAASEKIVNQLSSMPQLKALQTSEHHEKKKNKRERERVAEMGFLESPLTSQLLFTKGLSQGECPVGYLHYLAIVLGWIMS